MTLYMKVYDWKEARRALRGLQRNLRKYMRENLTVVWRDILHEAVGNAPEKSGLMKRSMVLYERMLGGTGLAVEILSTHYAYYQEKGFTHTSGKWIEGQHFCENAFKSHERDVLDAICRSVEEAVIHGG